MHDELIRPRKRVAPATTIIIGCFISACTGTVSPDFTLSRAVTADSASLLRDNAYLASASLEGRLTGTSGNDSAAAFIARRYRSLGLGAPYSGKYLQSFTAVSAAESHLGSTVPRRTQNVVAILRGRDPVLRNQYVVIGAHYDHLGRETTFALDPEARDSIRNGADDNASGTAVVMELARLLRQHPPGRSIVFVNFSGEEQGVLGSSFFVEHSLIPLDSIVGMVNFDMVGRLREHKLIVFGRGTASELRSLVDSVNSVNSDAHFSITGSDDGFGPSDHSSFYGKNIPVLHFFTDLHEDYHRATDDIERISAGGEARIANLARGVIEAIANKPEKLTFIRLAAPQQSMAPRQGSGVYLGTIPDMAGGDAQGLRLAGVRAGGPADVGGLKAGDIIIELGGMTVTDLYSYSDALFARKPGDKVKVVFLRGGRRTEVEIVLGKRG